MKPITKKKLQKILGLKPCHWGICKDASFQIWTHLTRLGYKPKLWSVSGHWWVEIDKWAIDVVLWDRIGNHEVIYPKYLHKKAVDWRFARQMR